MCHFHSICVNVTDEKNGDICHVPSNSHSEAIQSAGWPENRGSTINFLELEHDGSTLPTDFSTLVRYPSNPDHATNAAIKAGMNHYTQLYYALRGDSTALDYFASDTYWDVRLAVAKRTDNLAILSKLSDDIYWDVRRAVAERTNDPAILSKLSDDGYWPVRLAVAERKNQQF